MYTSASQDDLQNPIDYRRFPAKEFNDGREWRSAEIFEQWQWLRLRSLGRTVWKNMCHSMTGQSLSVKSVLKWKKSFGNDLNLCLLQEITALPCGTCNVALQPCPDSSARLHILFRYYQIPLIARAVLHQRCCGQKKYHNLPVNVNSS